MTKLIFTVEKGRTICSDCPFKSSDSYGCFVCGKDENFNLCNLDNNEFPEVTFENSPQEVELKLIKNDFLT